MNSPPSTDGHHRLLRAWQLALLRFAVTLDDCDRVNVVALAGELDRLDRRNADDSLHFFRRSSSRLCAAIRGEGENATAVLDRFCGEINEPRLRLAFASAAGIVRSDPVPPGIRPKRNRDLFRGLPTRRTASL
ncbi:hypothetical protein [Bradyrhizobium sp. CCGB20]|uniref:hypothetical protein n=1 Tax=Bradyrhizobium sp. CCGB20 TaxID=2949633 RepID=UPI0020B184DE|nr:hypothetical protein [Bradyrhizobium sp. CCGB20]MCP3402553.1 hypothetical protein [Bradyrhizobium sp. CCGB20]